MLVNPGGVAVGAQPPFRGQGGITETATSPGYNSLRPNSATPLAETLRMNGYSTAQFGRCHEVPVWETSPMGPFDHWPAGIQATGRHAAGSTTSSTSPTALQGPGCPSQVIRSGSTRSGDRQESPRRGLAGQGHGLLAMS